MANRFLSVSLVCLLGGAAVAGCGDDGGDPADDGDASPDEVDAGGDSLLGTWVVTAGPLLTAPGAEALVDSGGLILDEDGTGFGVFRDKSGVVISCAPIFHVITDDQLVIDFGAGLAPFGRVLTIDALSGDSAALHDDTGRVLFLARPRADLPEVVCNELALVTRHDRLPPTDGFTKELEVNATTAFYGKADNSLYSIDLATGNLNAQITNLFPPFLLAMQGASFWTAAGSGNNEVATLNAPGAAPTDTVDTGALGEEIQIITGAADGGGVLFLLGKPIAGANDARALLRIATTGEPDVLVATVENPVLLQVNAMAFDGTNLWGLTQLLGATVVKLDPTTGEVLANFTPPPDNRILWTGLAIEGGRMFLSGSDPQQTVGVLIEVELPAE